MSRGYTSNGRRLSSMTHASRSHSCELCGRVGFGNGSEAAHGRAHVRRGEAVEMVKEYAMAGMSPSRIFVASDDTEKIDALIARGFWRAD